MVLSDEEQNAYLLIHDKNKNLKNVKDKFIDVYLITNFELSDLSYQDVLSFSEDLLGMKYHCSYHLHTLKVEEEFVFDFPFDMMAIRKYVQEMLIRLDIKEQLPNFQEADFDHLSQD
ncbi:hypothetical protein [Peribacillus sp. NPDC097895]|uniref:hypothetical protein n=1 Tax=Peribacillus sp. NPDC097895 TaxID=3390619 RepID=UPI003D05B4F5